MLGKKLCSVKKLGRKVRAMNVNGNDEPTYHDCFLRDREGGSSPTGTFPVYVGEWRQRFVVPTRYLSHPLFKIMLDKAYDEFGFEQRSGLVIPCSVSAFQQVINAVECCNGRFDFGKLVEEFI